MCINFNLLVCTSHRLLEILMIKDKALHAPGQHMEQGGEPWFREARVHNWTQVYINLSKGRRCTCNCDDTVNVCEFNGELNDKAPKELQMTVDVKNAMNLCCCCSENFFHEIGAWEEMAFGNLVQLQAEFCVAEGCGKGFSRPQGSGVNAK